MQSENIKGHSRGEREQHTVEPVYSILYGTSLPSFSTTFPTSPGFRGTAAAAPTDSKPVTSTTRAPTGKPAADDVERGSATAFFRHRPLMPHIGPTYMSVPSGLR